MLIEKFKHCFTGSQHGERKPSIDLMLSFFLYFYCTQERQRPFKITCQFIQFNTRAFYKRHGFSKQHRSELQWWLLHIIITAKLWHIEPRGFTPCGFNPRFKLKPKSSEFFASAVISGWKSRSHKFCTYTLQNKNNLKQLFQEKVGYQNEEKPKAQKSFMFILWVNPAMTRLSLLRKYQRHDGFKCNMTSCF